MSMYHALEPLLSMAPLMASSSDSDSGAAWLLLAGPVAAGATYWLIWQSYRNTDKSNEFERTTTIDAQPVVAKDVKVDKVSKTSRTSISGDNRNSHRERVRRVE